MSEQWVRRFGSNRRRVGIVVAAAFLLLFAVWLVVLRPWPLARQTSSLQLRIDSAVESLAEYEERIEAALRLQFLESALVDGRRSTELRSDYRLIEEKLESIIARIDSESASALEAELSGLLPDLTRDRSAAARRLEEMQELLLPTAGLGRQRDNQ